MKFAVLIAIIAFATSSYAGSVTYRTSHPYRRADRGMAHSDFQRADRGS